jgi:hemerythrin superfamily protein
VAGLLTNKNKMRAYKKELETIADDLLNQNADAKGNENKPNYSKIDFMNATIIFQTAVMDKMYDNQEYDDMNIDERLKMAKSCGLTLRKFIHTYTGLDTHKIEEFL